MCCMHVLLGLAVVVAVSFGASVWCWRTANGEAKRCLDLIWDNTDEAAPARFRAAGFEIAKIRLDYYAKRHEEVNEWRQQTAQAFFALQSVVIAAGGAAIATVQTAKVGLLAFALAPIAVAGLCVYVRMAISRIYAVEQVNRYRLLAKMALGSPGELLDEGPQLPLSFGSHFWNDAAIAVLNSGVVVLAAYAVSGDAAETVSPGLWMLGAAAIASIHLLVYVLTVWGAGRRLSGRR
jgi:hypothetical protein